MNLGIDFNNVLNMMTATWPAIITAMVITFLVSIWIAERGTEGVKRRVPGTKTYEEYRHFKKYGEWPVSEDSEAWDGNDPDDHERAA